MGRMMLKRIALVISASAMSMAASAGTTTLVKSPFPAMLTTPSVLPAIDRISGVDGAKVGDTRTAVAGSKLLDLTVATKTTKAVVEIARDLSMTTGDATLSLKAGTKIQPDGRLMDGEGKIYFLLKADPESSTLFKRNRYFAITEDGGVLDHAFSALSDTYQTREGVTVTPGEMVVTKTLTTGPALCGLSTVFLGAGEGVAKFKVIRTDGNGMVTAQKERAFTSDLKTIGLPGAQLVIDKIDPNAVRVKVGGVGQLSCRTEI
ncbi:hypothetical protein [Ralstonia pseudosolanacearum]|uniref:hypothetical protein n=1 Tax=Ralstonia pseudosolanacearum TaxID=1310165 RepID=UPI003CF90EEB